MLEVQGLSVQFGSFRALQRVSVEVREGEIVVLLGANGAGKSTLFRAVSGLERASEGTVRLDGRDITRLPAHRIVREGVAQAPEGKNLFVEASVRGGGQVSKNVPDTGGRLVVSPCTGGELTLGLAGQRLTAPPDSGSLC